jgi:hypothetical protein
MLGESFIIITPLFFVDIDIHVHGERTLPVVSDRYDEISCRHVMASNANITRAPEVGQVKIM